jgi:hypothetical protein
MDPLNVLCKLCSHPFKDHSCSEDLRMWWCNGDLGSCVCDNYYPKEASGKDGDEIQVPYDSESYKWN